MKFEILLLLKMTPVTSHTQNGLVKIIDITVCQVSDKFKQVILITINQVAGNTLECQYFAFCLN